ncbi:MAG: bacillithiol transferase BstA [candidate division Zixibacteria bacterium]|nr:bacillithiol transferase BstA [candidate division Zixibacteria bacterium]
MTDLRYPIGPFKFEGNATETVRQLWIGQIAAAPALLRKAVAGLSEQQLDTPYREGGWTVRQVAHHVPDSHLNAYTRFKLTLTEEEPTIKPYNEKLWAELMDTKKTPIDISLNLLDSLHIRWVNLLRSLKPEDFKRTLQHPESGIMTLEKLLALYAWHGRHHTAHITSLRERMGW